MPVASPPLIPQPFATGGVRATIPNTGAGTGRASFDLGFPPITMQSKISGGLPPDGRDINGILYDVTAAVQFTQAGQPYVFDGTFAGEISGYALGAILGMSDGSGLWMNRSSGNTTDPDGSGATNWISLYSYGFTTKTGLTGGVVTLTPADTRKGTIVLQGTLVANLQILLPTTLSEWRIVNQTTGAFTTTVKTASGSGVVVPQGGFPAPISVYGDGTNIYETVSPAALPIDVNPTPSTIAQRSNLGYLFATYFNTNAAVDNISIVNIITDTGDGFLRKNTKANFQSQLSLSAFAGQVSNAQVPYSAVQQWAPTLFTTPSFTGTPTAPTGSLNDSSIQIATQAFSLDNQVASSSQSYHNVTGSRSAGVSYTNTTGRPIEVHVSIYSPYQGTADFYVNGAQIAHWLNDDPLHGMASPYSFIVPRGETYQVNVSGTATIALWSELS